VRLVMLGWEFPPYISGGLGTACHGLVCAMERLRLEMLFMLPMAIKNPGRDDRGPAAIPKVKALAPKPHPGQQVQFKGIPAWFSSPYPSSVKPRAERPVQPVAESSYSETAPLQRGSLLRLVGTGAVGGYDGDMAARIWDYADRCAQLTQQESFDVIHAHDWMTFPAGMVLAARSQRPLIVQIHATEFDRSGEHMNPVLYDIERRGMEAAVTVIAVSHLTKRTIVERYGIAPEKVRVIHNGIELKAPLAMPPAIQHKDKTVLFLGRITRQKGPEYFIEAAARVLERLDHIKFIMAGWGDLGPQVVEQVAALGLGSRVHFAGFLRGADVERAYRMADVYVLPSVSEPFGLTVLEAIQHGVPVILSKTSGVAEVLPTGALRCDFWDTHDIASKILAVLNHPELADHLRQRAYEEIRPLTWDAAARKCLDVYQQALS
jgi:glycogen(starch) synthase